MGEVILIFQNLGDFLEEQKRTNQKGVKFIFVTGGVLSGLGKGIVAASIGNILKARGLKIFFTEI